MVRERADALIASAVDDPNDPFSLVGSMATARGRALAARRRSHDGAAVRRPPRDSRPRRLSQFLKRRPDPGGTPPDDCRVVIEAGELGRNRRCARLEPAKTVAAIPCYPDTERDLAKLIDDELRVSSLRIAPDARAVPDVAARRRPPGLPQRTAQARALRPRQGRGNARGRHGGRRRRLGTETRSLSSTASLFRRQPRGWSRASLRRR